MGQLARLLNHPSPILARPIARKVLATKVRPFRWIAPYFGKKSVLNIQRQRDAWRRAVMLTNDKKTAGTKNSTDFREQFRRTSHVMQTHDHCNKTERVVSMIFQMLAVVQFEMHSLAGGNISDVATNYVVRLESKVRPQRSGNRAFSTSCVLCRYV